MFKNSIGNLVRLGIFLGPIALLSSLLIHIMVVPVLGHETVEAVAKNSKLTELTKLPNFSLKYNKVETPKADWKKDYSAEDWFGRVLGVLESKKTLSYRRVILKPGRYNIWLEKGKASWFHLYIGDKKQKDLKPIKAQFKLYELEDGIEQLKIGLKLVSKGTKLKFSIRAGQSEGHGNIKIVKSPSPDKASIPDK